MLETPRYPIKTKRIDDRQSFKRARHRQKKKDDLENQDAALELEDSDALESIIDDANMSDIVDSLCRPYSNQEPDVLVDQLSSLDAFADQVEISRIEGLGVLLPVSFSSRR